MIESISSLASLLFTVQYQNLSDFEVFLFSSSPPLYFLGISFAHIMTQPDVTNQGTSGHGLDEDEQSQLDAYNVDKLHHTKSLTVAQRQHFITSKTTEATLLMLNEQIAKRNELRRTSNEDARIMGPVEIALPMPTRSASVDLASVLKKIA